MSKFSNKKFKVPFDIKGTTDDASSVSGIDYPVSLKKVQEILNYLRTKKIHNPKAMYQDLRHTIQFLDIDDDVLALILASYIEDNGKTYAKRVHQDLKYIYLTPPKNQRGSNIRGKK